MKMHTLRLSALTGFFGTLMSVGPLAAQMQPAPTEPVVFRAQVVDLSCKQVYDLSGDMHRECAQTCADNGIPLGLLAEDGTLYLPVSAGMPGTGSNEALRAHAEHTVTVTGKRLTRAGLNSIIIESIEM